MPQEKQIEDLLREDELSINWVAVAIFGGAGAVGVPFLLYQLVTGHVPMRDAGRFLLTLAAAAGAGWVGFWSIAGRQARSERALEWLRSRQMVWAYLARGRSSGSSLVLAASDGTEQRIRLGGLSGRHLETPELDAVMAQAARRWPQATLGFSGAHQADYTADPRRLLRQPTPRTPAQARDTVNQLLASLPGPSEGKRIAVDAPFDRIAAAMERAGLRLHSRVEPGLRLDPTPVDPVRAEYVTPGARALYVRFEPTGLQTVQVVGEKAAEVFNDLLNVGYLPILQAQLSPMLASADRGQVLRALGAIEFVYAGSPGRFYGRELASLSTHEDPEIREAARRATAHNVHAEVASAPSQSPLRN